MIRLPTACPRFFLLAYLLQLLPSLLCHQVLPAVLGWYKFFLDAFCTGCSLFMKISPWPISSFPSSLLKVSMIMSSILKFLIKMHPQPHSLHYLLNIVFFQNYYIIYSFIIFVYIITFSCLPHNHARFTGRDLYQFYSEVSPAPRTVHGSQRCLIIFS